MKLAEFLERLEGVRRSGRGYVARCPAHDDRHASLSVKDGEDDRILVYCHAGCQVTEIVGAMSLKMADLYPHQPLCSEHRVEPSSRPRIVATFDYVDEHGGLLYQVVRYVPKRFLIRRPDGNGDWIWNLDDTRPVLYRLPEVIEAVKTGKTIWLPEGEKHVDRLCELGLSATTSSLGAGKWRDEYAEWLQGAKVVLLPDNDEPGRSHMEEIAHILLKARARVKVVWLPDLPPKGDVLDWLAAGGTVEQLVGLAKAESLVTLESLPAAHGNTSNRERANGTDFGHENRVNPQPAQETFAGRSPDSVNSVEWEQPVPFGVYTVPAFPIDALPGWLSAYCCAVATSTQTPTDLAGMLALSGLSTSLARKVEVQITSDWWEPVNIFVVVALPSGSRKSAVFRAITSPIEEHEKEENHRRVPLIKQAESDRRVIEKQLERMEKEEAAKRAGDPFDGDDRDRIIKELAEKEVPVQLRLIADDCTPEKLVAIMAEQRGRIAILSPEGDTFDLMAGRYAELNGGINGVYLKGHAGDDLRVDRKGSPPVYVHRPALTLGLAPQPDVLHGLMQKPGFRGRGLLARFVYSLPSSNVGFRSTETEPVSADVKDAYNKRLGRLLEMEVPVPYGTGGAGLLQLIPQAAAVFCEYRKEVEASMQPGNELGDMLDWGGKLPGAVARIAGLLHMAKHVDEPEPYARSIDCSTIEAAIRIGRYATAHAKIAYLMMGADPALVRAHKILDWISRKGKQEFSKREVQRDMPTVFRKAEEVDPALKVLIDRGWIRPRQQEETEGSVAGRPPSPSYEVHPDMTYSTNWT